MWEHTHSQNLKAIAALQYPKGGFSPPQMYKNKQDIFIQQNLALQWKAYVCMPWYTRVLKTLFEGLERWLTLSRAVVAFPEDLISSVPSSHSQWLNLLYMCNSSHRGFDTLSGLHAPAPGPPCNDRISLGKQKAKSKYLGVDREVGRSWGGWGRTMIDISYLRKVVIRFLWIMFVIYLLLLLLLLLLIPFTSYSLPPPTIPPSKQVGAPWVNNIF